MTACNPNTQACIIVERQLRAYNDRDLETFMACWHSDARLFQFPDTLLARGIAEIRSRHAARFAQPYLHAELLARHAAGSIVSDHEIVMRTVEGAPKQVAVIAIYEVGQMV